LIGLIQGGDVAGEWYNEFKKRTDSKDRYPLDVFTPRKWRTKIRTRNNHDFN